MVRGLHVQHLQLVDKQRKKRGFEDDRLGRRLKIVQMRLRQGSVPRDEPDLLESCA